MTQKFQLSSDSLETTYFPVNRSFIVQIDESVDNANRELKGRIEHIVTGQSVRFLSLKQLTDFIAANI